MSKALFLFIFASCVFGQAKAAPAAGAAPAPVMIEIADVDRASVDAIKTKLDEFAHDDNVSEVWLRINSHGGEVDAGLELIQAFDHYKKPLTCVVDVKAWSMGMSILEGCPHRVMTRRSTLMMHEVLVQTASGNAHDLADTASAVRAMTESLIQIAAGRMHLTANDIRAHIAGKQWWIDVEEALDVGAIDAIVSPADIPPLTELPKAPTLLELLGG